LEHPEIAEFDSAFLHQRFDEAIENPLDDSFLVMKELLSSWVLNRLIKASFYVLTQLGI
jgi:hypothetical protein